MLVATAATVASTAWSIFSLMLLRSRIRCALHHDDLQTFGVIEVIVGLPSAPAGEREPDVAGDLLVDHLELLVEQYEVRRVLQPRLLEPVGVDDHSVEHALEPLPVRRTRLPRYRDEADRLRAARLFEPVQEPATRNAVLIDGHHGNG